MEWTTRVIVLALFLEFYAHVDQIDDIGSSQVILLMNTRGICPQPYSHMPLYVILQAAAVLTTFAHLSLTCVAPGTCSCTALDAADDFVYMLCINSLNRAFLFGSVHPNSIWVRAARSQRLYERKYGVRFASQFATFHCRSFSAYVRSSVFHRTHDDELPPRTPAFFFRRNA